MTHVDLSRVPSFYHKYIQLSDANDLNEALRQHEYDLVTLLDSLPDNKWEFRYAPGKWTVKDLVQHIIDAERIFCYRALTFARNDKTELPGFEENDYAIAAEAGRRTSKDLLEELRTVQHSSVQLFRSFSNDQLEKSGIANGNSIYVKAIGYIVVGHTRHHMNILEERYLTSTPYRQKVK